LDREVALVAISPASARPASRQAVERFVSIDFETANEARDSACALGWAVMGDGEIVESDWTPIDPEISTSAWSDFNSAIHGMGPSDVRGAPNFAAAWSVLEAHAGRTAVVAHYASFDLSVLRAELARYEIAPPPLKYACSALLARAAWPLMVSVSLPLVMQSLGWELAERNPRVNALASGEIAVSAAARLGARDLDDALGAAGLHWGTVEPDLSWTPCGLPIGHVRAADLAPRTTDFDSSHPLFQKVVVFTGALESMSRREAFQRVYDVGGTPGDGVTKETNVLVVGEQDITRLADGETLSAKQRKARDLRATGQDIQLIGEDDFLRAL
jgi:DNA polymerase-3 subunit epsilon